MEENFSLKERNSFGMNVSTRYWAEFYDAPTLRTLIKEAPRPLFVMGGGSNLLFTRDYPGTILHSAIITLQTVCEDDSQILLKVGSGVVWDRFVEYVAQHGYWGAENLSGIPGEVGASAVQNVGAYGVEAKDIIEGVTAVSLETGEERVFEKSECGYGYRSSLFKSEKESWAITYVTFRLSKQPAPKLEYKGLKESLALTEKVGPLDVRAAVMDIRSKKLPDPKVLGSAGSFFKNPVLTSPELEKIRVKYPLIPYYSTDANHIKVPAAYMIEQCGLKGFAVGKAAVHHNQPLVLVNSGGATSWDVMELARRVTERVRSEFGVELEREVVYV